MVMMMMTRLIMMRDSTRLTAEAYSCMWSCRKVAPATTMLVAPPHTQSSPPGPEQLLLEKAGEVTCTGTIGPA
jgi:hypothetical protein